MKTTLEIADPLLEQARRIAARDGETLRSLVEQGLQKVVAERSVKAKPFKLRNVTVSGRGLRPEIAHLSMHDIILMSYEDRGG
jgi:Bacterial antitoxin of type II TA system, VapB